MLKIFHIVFYQFGAAINGIFNHNFDIKQSFFIYLSGAFKLFMQCNQVNLAVGHS